MYLQVLHAVVKQFTDISARLSTVGNIRVSVQAIANIYQPTDLGGMEDQTEGADAAFWGLAQPKNLGDLIGVSIRIYW